MPAKIFSATLDALDAEIVQVEVDISPGIPATYIVGLADKSIRESRERVRSCLRNSSVFKYPLGRISINLAPADLMKYGTQFDLGIVLGILLASSQIFFDTTDRLFLGELSLDGEIKPIKGALAMVLAAIKRGIHEIYLPGGNSAEALLTDGAKVFCFNQLQELVQFLTGATDYQGNSTARFSYISVNVQDFSEISDQDFAKRGLEIAVAGGHNVLMVGPPGAGKTMLARSMLSILPPPSKEQILEIVKINSIAGLIKSQQISFKPFRNPHHTITLQAFTGGGSIPRPGEITLAHHGILFLDEFPEFPRNVIETLRQPLEEGIIIISRNRGSCVFPARFIFVAAQNPCPCGFHDDLYGSCVCTPPQILKYKKKVSGPILDRIDLRIFVPKVDIKKISENTAETSGDILNRVCKARELQKHRYKVYKVNAQATRKEIEAAFQLSSQTKNLLYDAAAKYGFSARTYFRIIKISRTIADLCSSDAVLPDHAAEALQYRL